MITKAYFYKEKNTVRDLIEALELNNEEGEKMLGDIKADRGMFADEVSIDTTLGWKTIEKICNEKNIKAIPFKQILKDMAEFHTYYSKAIEKLKEDKIKKLKSSSRNSTSQIESKLEVIGEVETISQIEKLEELVSEQKGFAKATVTVMIEKGIYDIPQSKEQELSGI